MGVSDFFKKGEKMSYNFRKKNVSKRERKTFRGKQKKIRFESGNIRAPQILHFLCHERNVQFVLYKSGKMQNRRLELARSVEGAWNQTLASLASASIIKG